MKSPKQKPKDRKKILKAWAFGRPDAIIGIEMHEQEARRICETQKGKLMKYQVIPVIVLT